MPTYDYTCRACGAKHEFFQNITEGAKRKCPDCGKLKLKREIGKGSGIIFKGTPGRSGFYGLDYRSKNDGSDSKQDD